MDLHATALLPLTPTGPRPESLAGKARAGDTRSLDAVATGFESVFLAQLIKEMRQTLEPGGLFGDDKGDIQGGLFDLYLGQHLAAAGGFGLAAMLKRQLTHATAHEPTTVRSKSAA